MTGDELAAHITASYTPFLVGQRHAPSPHRHVYASGNVACERRMVLECTSPDRRAEWSPDTLAKFRRGDDRERDLLVDLARIGRDATPPFRVHNQQQQFDVKDRKGRVIIRGKVDARLEINGARPPVEIKAWSPNLVAKLENFSDVFDNPFLRSAGSQLGTYLVGSGEPLGLLIIDTAGIPKILAVELNDDLLERVELFMQRAERVVDHVEAGTLPDFHDDPFECQHCQFFGLGCHPPLEFPPVKVFSDPELEAALARRDELKAAASEYNELDAEVKKVLRGTEHAIVGGFEIKGKWQKYSRLDLPSDVRKQFTTVDPKGAYRLEITSLWKERDAQ